jgi:hypothetical protein
LWQQATTGARLTFNATLTYGAGTRVEAYTSSSSNPLNIRSHVFFQGVDVNTAQVVGGALEGVAVNGVVRNVFFG